MPCVQSTRDAGHGPIRISIIHKPLVENHPRLPNGESSFATTAAGFITQNTAISRAATGGAEDATKLVNGPRPGTPKTNSTISYTYHLLVQFSEDGVSYSLS